VGHGRWSGSDDAEALRALNRAVELGCNFFDTAYYYNEISYYYDFETVASLQGQSMVLIAKYSVKHDLSSKHVGSAKSLKNSIETLLGSVVLLQSRDFGLFWFHTRTLQAFESAFAV